jgi:hypothetical protein
MILSWFVVVAHTVPAQRNDYNPPPYFFTCHFTISTKIIVHPIYHILYSAFAFVVAAAAAVAIAQWLASNSHMNNGNGVRARNCITSPPKLPCIISDVNGCTGNQMLPKQMLFGNFWYGFLVIFILFW